MTIYNIWVGKCIECGANAYYNMEEDKTTFVKPAPDCLCELTEAQEKGDRNGSKMYGVRKNS
jgi:hypothetical protein